MRNPATHREAVRQLQERLHALIPEVVEAQQRLDGSLLALGARPLRRADEGAEEARSWQPEDVFGVAAAVQHRGEVEELSGTKADVRGHAKELALMKEIDDLARFCSNLAPLTGYLSQAEMALPDGNECRGVAFRGETLDLCAAEAGEEITRSFQSDLRRELRA